MGRVRSTSELVTVLAISVAIILGNAPLATGQDSGSGADRPPRILDEPVRGERAIEALGNRLERVAALNEMSAHELEELLLEDDTLWVDDTGRLFFVEPAPAPETIPADEPEPGPFPYEQTFLLNSKVGSSRTIFLDFDGHTVSGTAWQDARPTMPDPYYAAPFDLDGAPGTFNNVERDAVQSIWQRVAEDYSSFDVNVTTQDPGYAAINRAGLGDTVFGTRVLITDSPSTDITDVSSTGVAYRGFFDEPTWHDYYQPAWVFPRGLSDNTKMIAEVTTHEAGHTVGLSHDGHGGGAYYEGHGAWAPIMGSGYSRPIVQWSKGEYSTANNAEDDFAVMGTNGVSARTDDHTNSTVSASALATTATGIITPPGATTDADLFKYIAPASGSVTFNATPAPVSPNLDIRLRLYSADIALIADNNPASAYVNYDSASGLAASITHTVTDGATYYLQVAPTGAGDPASTGYSTYGSIGQYTVSASAPELAICPPDDGYEENDSTGAATPLTSGVKVSGTVCAADNDYYKIDAVTGGTLTIDVLFSHADGDVDVELLDPRGASLTEAVSPDDNEQIVHNVLETGTHYVRVYGYNGAENNYDLTATTAEAAAGAPKTTVVSSTVNVRPGSAVPAGTTGASLRSTKNEFESFQLVVEANGGPLTNLNVTPGTLTGPGGVTIPAGNVRIHRLEYVNLAVRSDAEGATGLWGDPLVPERDALFGQDRAAFPVAAVPDGEHRVAWVDVQVPSGATPGSYSGSIAVSSDEGSVNVPVTIDVLDLELPSTSSLTSNFRLGFFGFPLCQAHTGTNYCSSKTENWDLHARYAEMALNNRVTIGDPWPYDLSPEGPHAGFADLTYYQTHVRPLLNGTANTLLSGAALTLLAPAAYESLAVGDRCDPACMDAWRSEAQAQSFIDRLYYYPCDEPGTDAAKWTGCVTRANDANVSAPRVPAMVTGSINEASTNNATGAFDVLVPQIRRMHDKPGTGTYEGDQRANYDAYLADASKEVWLYTSCDSFSCNETESAYTDGWPGFAIDAPANQHRAMGWMAYRYDVTGHLYWHTAVRLQQAWNDCTVDNANCIYESGGNGDGTLFYPGNACAPVTTDRSCIGGTTDIPVESVRLKRLRDGHEDYELLRWLEANGRSAEAQQLVSEIYPTAYAATAGKDGPSATPGGTADTIDEARNGLLDLVAGAITTPSPTGTPIAFASNRDGDHDIFVMNTDGSGQTALTANASSDRFPSWSPDGSRIAFTSDRDGDHEVFVMQADGSVPQQITANAAVDEKPVWSPDGNRLAFVSQRSGNPDIWITDLYGNLLQVTSDAGNDHDPTWTPDGNSIVFASNRAGSAGVDLYGMRADGSGTVTRLTTATGDEDNPDVSFDGATLSYDGNTGGNYEVYSQPLAGGAATNLTNLATHEVHPAFSADDSRLVYASTAGGDYEIWLMNANGSSPVALTTNTSTDVWPDWKPTAPARPVNDDFSGLDLNAFPVTPDSNVNGHEEIRVFGTFEGATVQAGEPSTAGVTPTATVWFEWTAPGSGTWSVSNPHSTVDTVIGVYTGTAVNTLTHVASNDDNGDGMPWSLVDFQATAGQTYRIVVDNKYGGNHVYDLLLEQTSTTTTSVSVTEPKDGATVAGSVAIAASVTSDSEIAKVEFLVDGTVVGQDTTAPYAFTWDTTAVTDGSHTLRARATDTASNTTTSGPVTVTVDNTDPDTTAPSVAVTSPAAGSTVSGTTTFSATASDDVGVNRVEFLVDGTVVHTDTTSPYSFAWDTTTASNSDHTLRARARDAASNVTTSDPVVVTVQNSVADDTAPTVSVTEPGQGATVSGTTTVSATASDAVGVTRVEFLVDGSVAHTDTTSPYSFSWDTTTASNGDHQLSARARDAAGNTATSAAVVVEVRNTDTQQVRREVEMLGGESVLSPQTMQEISDLTGADVGRLSGLDRYSTAAAIVADAFPGTVDTVYVATGANFPDALAGSAAATKLDAPVLLVAQDHVPDPIAEQLRRLAPSTVKVLGGSTVVSNDTLEAIRQLTGATVVRIAGTDRYSTAAAIVADAFPGTVDTVYVATGANFPDALAGSAAAATLDAPVLLVSRDGVPGPVAEQLGRLAPSTVKVLGGSTVVSDATLEAIRQLTGATVVRIAGTDRYLTAAAIVADAFPDPVTRVYVATGQNFPDALAGSAAAAVFGAPVLLASRDEVPEPIASELVRLVGSAQSG